MHACMLHIIMIIIVKEAGVCYIDGNCACAWIQKLMAIVPVLGYKNYNLEARSVTEWAGLFKLTIAVATNLLLP